MFTTIYNDFELDVISRGIDIEEALARAIEDQEIINDMNDTDWNDED